MKRLIIRLLLVLFLCAPVGPGRAALLETQPEDSAQKRQDEILQYLDRNIEWYRDIDAARAQAANARGVAIGEMLRENSLNSLRLGFEFARAEAAMTGAAGEDTQAAPADKKDDSIQRQRLASYRIEIAKQMASLRGQLERIKKESNQADGGERSVIEARRIKVTSELALAAAQYDLLKKMTGSLNESDTGEPGGFAGAIAEMERSLPELREDSKVPALEQSAKNGAPDRIAKPGSLIGILAEILPLSQKRGQIGDLINQTEDLKSRNTKLMQSLRTAMIGIVNEGRQNAAPDGEITAEALRMQSANLDSLTSQFRRLSPAVAPLGKQSMIFDASRAALLEWRTALDREFTQILRRLTVRLIALAVVIAIPLLIAEISRRATSRYVHDVRRRRQLRIVRRVILSIVIGFAVLLSFFTEFSSFATFAGFLTAGLAFALQNVILSIVAYFFLFGKFGIRVGERVTISGVTGEVIEVGLIRLYMMELAGNSATGRIVVFPNSIFFQPSAFFKQVAGANFTWHEIHLLFAPQTDDEYLRSKLMQVAGMVYADYHMVMKRYQTILEGATHLKVDMPKPEIRLEPKKENIAFTLRYPVEMERSAEIDKRMTDAIMQAIEEDAQLQLSESGVPAIKPGVEE